MRYKVDMHVVLDFAREMHFSHPIIVQWAWSGWKYDIVHEGHPGNRGACGFEMVAGEHRHRLLLSPYNIKSLIEANITALHELGHAVQHEYGIDRSDHFEQYSMQELLDLGWSAVSTSIGGVVMYPPEGVKQEHEDEADWFAETYKSELRLIRPARRHR